MLETVISMLMLVALVLNIGADNANVGGNL